ncbi:nitroreductase family protein [Thermoflexibacter ruber]|uniref:Putative NAD(P)H nitroreductase n=1 Tax=Thermoflexibacter ruber TaxID=1003 RepID=A0A1I2C2M0_9BACT|nr:nitroreductase [Thermoflexibacter ruber]SFE62003.1 Nitroreductase [Thermoflexibacter ruber]
MQTNYNTEQINHLIRHRRSTFPRQYSGEKVEKAIIEQILENANWAPTHGKTEPWRFFVFTGEGLQKFADFQAEMYQKFTPLEKFSPEKYEKMKQDPLKASHIIGIAMKRQKEGKIPEIEEVEAVACAVQNMYLTATAYGLGAYWSTGGVTYMEEAKEFFGLGEKDKLLGFFYIGKIATPSPDGERFPISEKVSWIEN